MQETIRKNKIIGSRCFSNYFWTFFLSIGGISFLLAGLSSYIKINLLPFTNSMQLVFIPQGLVMIFYGTLSLLLSLYILLMIILDVGSGYNEFNKIENLVKIVRKGFPGKNREILLTYSLTNIKSIGVKISEGLNPKRIIYLCLKDERKIPLTPINKPITISEIETESVFSFQCMYVYIYHLIVCFSIQFQKEYNQIVYNQFDYKLND